MKTNLTKFKKAVYFIKICYAINMTKQNIVTIIKKYQKSPEKKRLDFLRAFEEKMIYRTTKTENPQTTHKIVQDVLRKLAHKV